jgi:glycosyltransferase involved in cell wall biosynthesis
MEQPTDIKPLKICAVIPCLNESERIGKVISEIIRTVPSIVCVDDCSSDNTAEIAEAHGATVLRHCVNLGQGAALATGFDFVLKNTDSDVIVTIDGDGQHDPQDIPAMVNHLRSANYDVVFGSRFSENQPNNIPLMKRVGLKFATALTNLSTGVKLSDTHNGFRAISRESLRLITPTQRGMAHATEMIQLTGKNGLRYSEFPVHVRYGVRNNGGGQSILNSLNILWDLIWR